MYGEYKNLILSFFKIDFSFFRDSLEREKWMRISKNVYVHFHSRENDIEGCQSESRAGKFSLIN